MVTWREDWCIQLDEDRRGERRNSEKRPYTSTHHTHCLVHWTRQVLQSRMDKLWENVSQDCHLCINSCWLLDLKHREVLDTLLGNWGTLRKISTGGVESGLLRTITEPWYLQPAPGRIFCAESWQCWRPLLGMQEFKKRLVGSRCGGVLLRGAQNCHLYGHHFIARFFFWLCDQNATQDCWWKFSPKAVPPEQPASMHCSSWFSQFYII